MNFSLCFVCPARFCEITDNAEYSAAFLKKLVSPSLAYVTLVATLDTVVLNYSQREHMYYIQVYICYQQPDADYPIEETKLQLEGRISQSLLQCFWEVNVFGC